MYRNKRQEHITVDQKRGTATVMTATSNGSWQTAAPRQHVSHRLEVLMHLLEVPDAWHKISSHYIRLFC
jgi:hypothetical protein